MIFTCVMVRTFLTMISCEMTLRHLMPIIIEVASDVRVNFKNVGVLSIESSLFHLFHYTFLQTKHQKKGY